MLVAQKAITRLELKRMPRTEVHAFDLDVSAQSKCAELAEKNSVQDRLLWYTHPVILRT